MATPPNKTTVTGPFYDGRGNLLADGRIIFTRGSWDKAGNAVIVHGGESVEISEGQFSIPLALTDGDRGELWGATYIYPDHHSGREITMNLGVFALEGAEPMELGALIGAGDHPPSTQIDALAAALAAKAAAQAASSQAALDRARAEEARDVTIEAARFDFQTLALMTAWLTANGAQGDGTIYIAKAEGFTYKEQAVSPTVTFGGVGLRVEGRVGDFAFEAFGGGINKTGAENSAALLAAVTLLKDVGGQIIFSGGRFEFSPQEYPVCTKTVKLLCRGYRATSFVPSVYDGASREWMMQFGADDGSVTHMEFEGIEVEPPVRAARSKFHGIKVRPSNQMVTSNCFAINCDGTAWQFERAHNSKIDVRTFQCGSSADQIWAVNIAGTLADFAGNPDAVFNDTIITGMTEQDYYGWNIENGLVIRPESSLKVHGGGNTARALRVLNVSNGAMSVYPTLAWSHPEMITVADGGSGEVSVIPVTTASMTSTFELNIISNSNLRYLGTGVGALVGINMQSAASRFVGKGSVLDVSYTSPATGAVHVRFMGDGNPGAIHDISQLKGPYTVAEFIEDNRLTTTSRVYARPPLVAAASPVETTLKQTTVRVRNTGELIGVRYDGLSDAPPFQGIGIVVKNDESRGAVFGRHVCHGQINTSLSAAAVIIPIQSSVAGEDAAGTDMAMYLRRVDIGVLGVAAAFDASNYWSLEIYKGTAVSQTLKLSRGTLTSASGDGYPSRVKGNGTIGYLLDYWLKFGGSGGLIESLYYPHNEVAARLVPTGAPPALTQCSVQLHFEIRQ